MRKLAIDLSDLEPAFEQTGLEMSYYLDLETGAVVLVTDEARAEWEDIAEEVFDADGQEQVPFADVLERRGLPEGMKEAVQIAEQVEAGFGNRYIRVPRDDSREAYRDMEDFIESVPDGSFQDRLARAIRGKGAFGRFKDVLAGVPAERERWFAFRDARVRQRVLDWLASEDIAVVSKAGGTERQPGASSESEERS
jgi:hypothetical protein